MRPGLPSAIIFKDTVTANDSKYPSAGPSEGMSLRKIGLHKLAPTPDIFKSK